MKLRDSDIIKTWPVSGNYPYFQPAIPIAWCKNVKLRPGNEVECFQVEIDGQTCLVIKKKQ